MPNELLVHDRLFDLTKDYYKADDLFAETHRLEISEDTFRRIVKEPVGLCDRSSFYDIGNDPDRELCDGEVCRSR